MLPESKPVAWPRRTPSASRPAKRRLARVAAQYRPRGDSAGSGAASASASSRVKPCWSIDALYGVSLLVCMTRRELDTHARRLLTAQAVAFACFVLVPLRFTFTQPDVDGVYGWMFAALAGFDQPFNQLPSLHIALAVILWALYVRRLSGIARLVMEGWFLLICGSVLTTYQHHFIDIPTGALLGVVCVWLWPLERAREG